MLRVLVRHINDADSTLVGDLPPSEVRALLELLGTTDISWGDRADVGLYEGGPQFIESGGMGAPRLCYEILLDGGA